MCVCVSVRVCQNNATGHKFNLANKHVGMHTHTHTHKHTVGERREAAGDVSTVCYKNQLQPCAELFGRAISHAS